MESARKLLARLRGVGVPGLLALTVAFSLLVEEAYPFSHFPMYSRFHPRTWYVYATDGEDIPFATWPAFRTSTARLKKRLRSERAALERTGVASEVSEAAAGRRLLAALAERNDEAEGLRLWRVDIRRTRHGIVQEVHLVAERQ